MGVISKNPIACRPFNLSGPAVLIADSTSPATTRFVLVPIRVNVPPSVVAKQSGMRSFDGEYRCRFAKSMVAGVSTATIGVLFRNALTNAVGMQRFASVDRIPLPDRSRSDASHRIVPVFCIPAATTNKAATVRRPSFPKPRMAVPASMTPASITTTNPQSKAISGARPRTIKMTAVTRTAPTSHGCHRMGSISRKSNATATLSVLD